MRTPEQRDNDYYLDAQQAEADEKVVMRVASQVRPALPALKFVAVSPEDKKAIHRNFLRRRMEGRGCQNVTPDKCEFFMGLPLVVSLGEEQP